MNQSDWYAKLLEWSHTDSRLGRLPYVLMVVLAEHLAERDAAEHSAHPTLGIRAAFQAFVYAVKYSFLTAFRRPPQRW